MAEAAGIIAKAEEANTRLLAEMTEASENLAKAEEANTCLLAEKAEAADNIVKAEEANIRLLAEKAEVSENLDKAAIHSTHLLEEVDALKSEKRDCQELIASLHKLRDDADTLEDEVEYSSVLNLQVDSQRRFAEADLYRTGRLLNLHDNDLVDRDEIIVVLSAEKAMLQADVTNISNQLAANDVELVKAEEANMRLLAEMAEAAENLAKAEEANTCLLAEKAEAADNIVKAEEANIRLLAEKAEVSENLDKAAIHSTHLLEEVDALKSEKRDCQELIASLHKLRDDADTLEDEVEYSSVLNLQVDSQRRFAEADLYRTGRLLNLHDNDLVDRDEIIVVLSAEKAMLQADVTNISNQLAANDAELDRMKNNQSEIEFERDMLKSREETLKAELEALAEEKQSEEALKVTIDALEKENSALREQANVKPPSSSSSSDITSPWEPTPIKSVKESLLDTTFAADDTFDESMFLPNVDGEADTPQTGDSNTPSKTPFKEKRALFSPMSREVSAKKAQTPAKRLTRAMRNKMRTPLGKSAVQNTPLSTHLSRRKSGRASTNKTEVAKDRKL